MERIRADEQLQKPQGLVEKTWLKVKASPKKMLQAVLGHSVVKVIKSLGLDGN